MMNTPIRIKIEKQTQEDRSLEDQRIAPLWETRQWNDNCSRHCLLSNREPRNEASSAGATTKPPSSPPESRNRRFHTKDWTFQCLPPLMWTGGDHGVFKNIPGAFIMQLPCSTIDPLGYSTCKHKFTPMFSIESSTPDSISSLFSIIGSLAAPDLLRKTVVGT